MVKTYSKDEDLKPNKSFQHDEDLQQRVLLNPVQPVVLGTLQN